MTSTIQLSCCKSNQLLCSVRLDQIWHGVGAGVSQELMGEGGGRRGGHYIYIYIYTTDTGNNATQ